MARIVVVSNSLTYLLRFRHELLQSMQQLGHEVVVLCPADGYAQQSVQLSVQRIDLPLAQHGLNPFGELRTVLILCGKLRQLRPDLVLNFTIKPALYGSIGGWIMRAPRIVSVFTGLGYWFTRPSESARLVGRVIRFGLRFALRANALVFFQNQDDRRLFVDEGLVEETKTRIVDGSGVDVTRFAPLPTAPHPQTFLLVGRLLREKGIREYVAAARLVRAAHPKARFWLLGPIDTSPSAIGQEELRQWRERGDIEYLGEVADVRDVVAQASVVVLPSYREGTPRSVLEAMAMGKAIVTSDAPGCRETVQDGVNGFLVPVGDAGALAAAMTRFIEEPALIGSFGAESRRIVTSRYDVKRVNESFLRNMDLM